LAYDRPIFDGCPLDVFSGAGSPRVASRLALASYRERHAVLRMEANVAGSGGTEKLANLVRDSVTNQVRHATP